MARLRTRARALFPRRACRRVSRVASRAWAPSMQASTSSRSPWREHASVTRAARVYFGLGSALGLDWIRDEIERLPVDGHWQAVARGSLREEAYLLQRRLSDHVVGRRKAGDAKKRIDAWLKTGGTAYENLSRTVKEMRSKGSTDFPTLSVALRPCASWSSAERPICPGAACWSAPRAECVEPRQPLHRLDRRRADGAGP